MASYRHLLLAALNFLPLTTLLSAVNNFHYEQEFSSVLSDLEHAQEVVETEVRVLANHVEHQDELIRSFLREQSDQKRRKEMGLDLKFLRLEEKVDEKIKEWDAVVAVLKKYKQSIGQLEQDLTRIEKAMQVLLAMFDEETQMHVVEAGDCLEKIANHYKTSVPLLKEKNHLDSDRIVVGQKLVIP